MLKIGISACLMHKDKNRILFAGRKLLFIEESLAHYVMSQGAIAYIIPSWISEKSIQNIVKDLDGVVFHGGADVYPGHYGETPLKEIWSGDKERDILEFKIFELCRRYNKPVLGVCRGAQMINVALGGSLFQDIHTQVKNALEHRNQEDYEKLTHQVELVKGSLLEKIYKTSKGKINSVHHQSIKDLGEGLVIEAFSPEDKVVEAIRLDDKDYFCLGVQWHPEFHESDERNLLDSQKLLKYFLNVVKKTKLKTGN